MNRCPTCGRLYDADVQFCPTDGAHLEPVASPQPVAPAAAPAASRTMPILVGVLVLVVVVLAGLMLWQQQASKADLAERAATAEADAQAARAEAERQSRAARAEAQRAADATSEADQATADRDDATAAAQSAAASARAAARAPRPAPFEYRTTGDVYSPSDGFLALRGGPSSSSTMLSRIPHGSPVALGTCRNATFIAGRSGSWCRARYNGTVGWVFNAFISYRDYD